MAVLTRYTGHEHGETHVMEVDCHDTFGVEQELENKRVEKFVRSRKQESSCIVSIARKEQGRAEHNQTDSIGWVAYHRHHEDEEGEGGQPEVPEGAVLQGPAPLGCGLEGDHAAEQLGCDGPPVRLHQPTTTSTTVIVVSMVCWG